MKKDLAGLLCFIITVVVLSSCKKEKTCEVCVEINRPPVANAGNDQTTFLPTNKTNLDGSSSIDMDNNITSYAWTKISGPSFFNIANSGTVKTEVTNLAEGTYLFELKVTDAEGLWDRDTVQIDLKRPSQQHLGNVIFYCPDPTGTMNYIWQTWDNGDPVNGLYNLITIKIDSLSGSLAGVWSKNGRSPRCPVETDYYVELGNHASFNLPPGIYSWSAENKITNFSGWPGVTADFALFFGQTRKVEGIVTVGSGDKCIVQPIIF